MTTLVLLDIGDYVNADLIEYIDVENKRVNMGEVEIFITDDDLKRILEAVKLKSRNRRKL